MLACEVFGTSRKISYRLLLSGFAIWVGYLLRLCGIDKIFSGIHSKHSWHITMHTVFKRYEAKSYHSYEYDLKTMAIHEAHKREDTGFHT